MNIAHLARAENELLASPFEDKLGFVFREHVRGAIVLLRQLLLPLHHFAGEANDHVVLIGLSVDRDGTERGPSDLHGLILVPRLTGCLKMHESRAIALRSTLLAFRFTVHATRLPRAPSPRSGSAFSPSRPQKRSTGLNSRICSEDVASGSNRWLMSALPRKRTNGRRLGMSALCQYRIHAVQQKAFPKGKRGAVTSASDPRYCLSACAFSAVNSASLRKVITATLRVR